jgi:3-oxoacyl-[acyl-carrier-protein] synthase-3
MIYSDGAGASVIEASDDEETGLLSMKVVLMRWMKLTICFLENHTTQSDPDTRYIKMHGRKIYEFANYGSPQ